MAGGPRPAHALLPYYPPAARLASRAPGSTRRRQPPCAMMRHRCTPVSGAPAKFFLCGN